MAHTEEQLRAAKGSLRDELHRNFNAANGLIGAIGMARAEGVIEVRLLRDPTETETERLPKQYQGFGVRYRVSGKIHPQMD